MVGEGEKLLQACERDVRAVSRQSLVAVRDLPAGHVLAAGDLEVKRPGTGICASRLDEMVGRRLARAVAADRVLHEADIACPCARRPRGEAHRRRHRHAGGMGAARARVRGDRRAR
ncbi:MAG: SAF domain-containing protein [Planctomycetota bacterium]